MTRPIFFLSDFGLSDTYVGVVKAVILGIAPGAAIVDLTHAIPAQDVRAGAFALLAAAPYLPADAVVLAVVDPGVGTSRPAVAVGVSGRAFVAPDNGLLSWAVERLSTPTMTEIPADTLPPTEPSQSTATAQPAARPMESSSMVSTEDVDTTPPANHPVVRSRHGLSAVSLDRPRYWLPTVSATFHGRDLFGPVAAHLARGVPLTDLGTPLDTIQALPFPRPSRADDVLRGEVIHVDHFGNLVTNLTAADLPPEPVVQVAGRSIVGLSAHFQASTDLVALIGSSGFLEIAVPNGSAASYLHVTVGGHVVVIRAE